MNLQNQDRMLSSVQLAQWGNQASRVRTGWKLFFNWPHMHTVPSLSKAGFFRTWYNRNGVTQATRERERRLCRDQNFSISSFGTNIPPTWQSLVGFICCFLFPIAHHILLNLSRQFTEIAEAVYPRVLKDGGWTYPTQPNSSSDPSHFCCNASGYTRLVCICPNNKRGSRNRQSPIKTLDAISFCELFWKLPQVLLLIHQRAEEQKGWDLLPFKPCWGNHSGQCRTHRHLHKTHQRMG